MSNSWSLRCSLPSTVEPQKRSWIYGGIAHPPNVVLARRDVVNRRRLPPGSSLLLAGDEHAWGLAPFMKLLCRDGQVEFSSLCAPGTLLEWPYRKALVPALDGVSMVVVSLAFGADDDDKLAEFAKDARSRGATLVWLRPLRREAAQTVRPLLNAAKVPSFHSEALDLARGPDGVPTARGYAGLAGALWRWIG